MCHVYVLPILRLASLSLYGLVYAVPLTQDLLYNAFRHLLLSTRKKPTEPSPAACFASQDEASTSAGAFTNLCRNAIKWISPMLEARTAQIWRKAGCFGVPVGCELEPPQTVEQKQHEIDGACNWWHAHGFAPWSRRYDIVAC